jgi:signal peptidase
MFTKREASLLLLFLTFIALAILLAFRPPHEVPAAIIKGRSMLPLLREGDLVFVVRCDPSDIRTGDIVIYRSKFENKLIIHRVIDIRYENNVYYFVTKGDNNFSPDISEFDFGLGVNQNRIVGKVLSIGNYVVKIPYIGHLALMLRGG